MNPFLSFLGDFVIKASLAALKEYQAQENVKQIERQKAELQHKEFVIAYQDFMLRATLNPELYDQLQSIGKDLRLPDTTGAGTGADKSGMSSGGVR